MRLLAAGQSYAKIEQATGASATTIARVSKCLSYGAGGYRSALDVTLWATNRNEGGWTVYAAQTFAATNAGVYRVAFPGEYLPADVKIGIGSIGAATTATAFILTY